MKNHWLKESEKSESVKLNITTEQILKLWQKQILCQVNQLVAEEIENFKIAPLRSWEFNGKKYRQKAPTQVDADGHPWCVWIPAE